ncbi:PREDICTED: uncharacterized protein LOC109381366 isoform X2 [Hipposideros armiger]|uniref:Uncharacterized protein LOC109381366 isoform X2 n=1 Tax=Hipposideros armiger TaxID=186990 RepID=A0A8B7R4C2_HIPAR|nr:PREDICTED: uncharacterized protein LOC109381366 isoform X2 [Hipposideros armiger]
MASFGLRSAVQPLLRPLSGGWPGSLQAGFAQPSQAAQDAARAPGATCCISAEKCFSGCASWGGEGEQELSFLFAARVRRAGFPGTDSPRRVDSPAAGGSLSKSCLGRGLAAAPQLLSPRSPHLLVRGPGLRVRPQWNSRGRSRSAQAASGRDPSRRVARKPGGNSFFPHSAPRGCRRGKRRRRREDRPRQGEEETLSGFASGQSEPGTPSTTLREVRAARSPPALYRSLGEHSLSAKSCRRATVSRG